MRSFVEVISISSVLRPILLLNKFESVESVASLLEESQNHTKLRALLLQIKSIYEAENGEGLEFALEERIALDDVLGVCLIGELFFEEPESLHRYSVKIIDKYEGYLQSRSSVYSSFSRAKLKLNQFRVSGTEKDLVEALDLFNRAKQSGNITASILYHRLQIARLAENRVNGTKLRYYLEKTALFLAMIPTVWDSVEDVTPNRWWRYSELTQLKPRLVNSLDNQVRSGKARWRFGGNRA
jgi:TPR repeat protein